MQYLVSKIPFLALPIINPLAAFVVGYILKIAIRESEFGLFFLFIDTRTNRQGIAFVEAANANKIAQDTGSPEQKSKAEKALIDSFRQFAKFTN